MRARAVTVMALLVVAFVILLSALAERPATQHATMTGIVAEFEAGQRLTIVSDRIALEKLDDQGDQTFGLQIHLTPTTTYHSASDPIVIKRGARVYVWYRSVSGESRLVADKVLLFEDAKPQ